MKHIEVTIRHIIKEYFLFLLFLICSLIIFIINYNSIEKLDALYVGLILYSILYLIPEGLILFNYIFNSSKTKDILIDENRIQIKDKIFKINEIELHASRGYYYNEMTFLTFSNRYYYKITVNDGQVFFISSLTNISKIINKDLEIVKYRERFFPTIYD